MGIRKHTRAQAVIRTSPHAKDVTVGKEDLRGVEINRLLHAKKHQVRQRVRRRLPERFEHARCIWREASDVPRDCPHIDTEPLVERAVAAVREELALAKGGKRRWVVIRTRRLGAHVLERALTVLTLEHIRLRPRLRLG